jgi:hypothetical protein
VRCKNCAKNQRERKEEKEVKISSCPGRGFCRIKKERKG